MMIQDRNFTRKLAVVLAIVFGALGTTTRGGGLNVQGDLNVTGNLTAQSITLGNAAQTNWPSAAGGVADLSIPQIDFSAAPSLYRITLTDNVSWVFTNHSAGAAIYLQVSQDAVGGWSNSWPSNVAWPGGTAPGGQPCPSAFSLYKFVDGGTYWIGQAEALNCSLPCVSNCNYALQFGGAQSYVSINTSNMSQQFGDLTIEAWFKFQVPNDGGRIISIGSGENQGSDVVNLAKRLDGTLAVENYLEDSAPFIASSTALNDGSWHFIAMVRSGFTNEFFVDGISQGTDTSDDGGWIYSSLVTFGADTGNTGEYPVTEGTLDEVRISNIARGIAAECSGGCPSNLGSDNNTVGYWKFNEGNGSTTADSSANGHTGTLQGSTPPQWVVVNSYCGTSASQGAGYGFAQAMSAAISATISNIMSGATTTGIASNNSARATH